MQVFRRVFIAVFLFVVGCAAQSPVQQDRAIEHQVRATFQIPAYVQIQVGARKPSDFANYDAVTLTLVDGERKQPVEFLISKDGKTLVRLQKLDLTKDPYADTMAKINLQGRPVRGNKDAKVTIVSFDDFQCPYCSKMHQTLFSDVFSAYADRVRVIYKDFPLPMHEWATRAAVDANCLGAQKPDAYWDLADYIHANQSLIAFGEGKVGDAPPKRRAASEEMAALDKLTLDYGQKHQLDMPALQACVKAQKDDAVRASVGEAEQLGINGTPTLFVNGEKIDGLMPAQQIREIINRALREVGEPVPPPPAPSAAKPAASPGK